MKNKVLIFTGGTGGHVIPALNFANYLISKGKQCSIIVDKRGAKFLQSFKGKLYIINSSHLSGTKTHNLKGILILTVGFFQSIYIILKYKLHINISIKIYTALLKRIFKELISEKIRISKQNIWYLLSTITTIVLYFHSIYLHT